MSPHSGFLTKLPFGCPRQYVGAGSLIGSTEVAFDAYQQNLTNRALTVMAFWASFLILSSSALSSKIFCGMPVGCSLALANKVHNSWESRCKTQPQHTAPLPHLQKLHTCPHCSETHKAITSAHACHCSRLCRQALRLTQANECTLTNRLVFFSRKPVRAICNIFGSKFCTTNHSVM